MNSSLEQSIINVIRQTATDLGFDIVKVNYHGDDIKTLEILIDRLDGQHVSIGDCRLISKNLSPLLDVADIISNKYFLHVSSAGVERPLVKIEDYSRFVGREIQVKLKEKLSNCANYKGKIFKVDNNDIVLESGGENIVIPFQTIKNAHLILTDEMFKKLLNKEQSAL